MNYRTLSRNEVGPPSKAKSRSISVRAKPLEIWALVVSFPRAIAGDTTTELFGISTRHNRHPSSSAKRYRLMATKPGALPFKEINLKKSRPISRRLSIPAQ